MTSFKILRCKQSRDPKQVGKMEANCSLVWDFSKGALLSWSFSSHKCPASGQRPQDHWALVPDLWAPWCNAGSEVSQKCMMIYGLWVFTQQCHEFGFDVPSFSIYLKVTIYLNHIWGASSASMSSSSACSSSSPPGEVPLFLPAPQDAYITSGTHGFPMSGLVLLDGSSYDFCAHYWHNESSETRDKSVKKSTNKTRWETVIVSLCHCDHTSHQSSKSQNLNLPVSKQAVVQFFFKNIFNTICIQ